MKRKTKDLTMMSLLIAIMALLGFTPLGNITWGPVSITLLGIPVMVGTLVLGLKKGIVLGVVFGVISFLKLFLYPSPLLSPLLLDPLHWYDAIFYVIVLFVPRILVPITTYFVGKLMRTKLGALNYGVASLIGSLTNTVFFLLLLYLLFQENIAVNFSIDGRAVYAMLYGIGASNGLAEAVLSAVVCSAVVVALKRVYRGTPKQPGEAQNL